MLTCFHVAWIIFVRALVRHVTMERLTAWCVSSSLRQTLYPQEPLTIVVLGRIHTITMVSNVSTERSAVQDRGSQFPLDINKDPHCEVQPAANTLLTADGALNYSHNISMPPTPNRHKKAVKNSK
jgi:hypothetical protein